jgi:aspartyl-tRNA(Asn)/glutamyl-tRNA(Gln) amidotransferase subunit C
MATTLTRDDVIKLANLARIDLADSEIDSFIKDLSSILDYVEQLSSVDLSGLQPTNQVTGLSNVWRDDQLIDYGYKATDLLNNVPKKENNFIKVNRMIE